MVKLTIVIPVYNESEIIETVIKDWAETLHLLNIDSYKINIYNDGSTDTTLQKLNSLAHLYKDVVKVVDKPNSGHGPTILQGYRESVKSEWVFQVDSDNEISPLYFKEFWEKRNDYDLIIGTRKGRGNSTIRRLMTFVAHRTVCLFYGKGIKDVNIPYRLMRQEAFGKYFQSIPSNTFTPNIILSGIAVKNKLKLMIVDVESTYRATGISTLDSNIFKLMKISFQSFKEVITFAHKVIGK